jgi:endonuclease/exonuclease/phosphatase family metal-dependent hydrolase
MRPPRLRVMSYNIRHGRGLDGKVDLGRIADVIASRSPDVVALQEVDQLRPRSGAIDQAEELGRRLGMEARFAPCMTVGDALYGLATLTRGDVVDVLGSHQIRLPHTGGRFSEPRCALVTRVRWAGAPGGIDVVNTHLSLRPAERGAQAAALGAELHATDVILAGDFNCTPRSDCYRVLGGSFRAALARGPSWPSRMPVLQLDHLLYGAALEASEAAVVRSREARRASDHLPIVAAFHHAGDPLS